MGEALGAGVEFVSSLFSGGGADALASGIGTIGEGAAGAAAGGGGGLADLVGTGAGLFGGSTGLEGTLLAGGAAGGLEGALGAGAAGGALGTAEAFMGAPGASGFNASAISPGAFNDALPAGATATSGNVSPNGIFGSPTATPGVATTGPQTVGSVPGLSSAGPAGPAAPSAAVAPSGAGATDLTSQAIPGASGYSSVGGPGGPAPLTGGSAGGSGGGSFMDSLVSGAEKNALPAAIAAGGLGYNVLKGGGAGATAFPSGSALNSQAAQLAQSSPQLMQYLTSGTLPQGMQTALTKATQDAKTAAISNAARSGQPTDPSQNSTLAGELAQIDQQQSITAAQLGQQLLTAGLSEAQLSASDYSTLLNADQSQQKNISDSIANFAKALGGMGGGINLQLAK